jgi:hypothetical protein
MFVPLRHDPGHAQVDFGEAFAVHGADTVAIRRGLFRTIARGIDC